MTNAGTRSVFLRGNGTVFRSRLHLSPLSLIDSGHFPHPARMLSTEYLKNRAGYDREVRRKLYISRRDTRNQPLLNEDALIEMLRGQGFEILSLAGLPVQAQIKYFAEASCIVAQHGAGNANVVFCPPGAAFCEIHIDSYVQWSMRRLASVVPLRYGCVIGHEVEMQSVPSLKLNGIAWSVDVDEVETAVKSLLT
jgi:capsular polysaccharide biosynthesis protein